MTNLPVCVTQKLNNKKKIVENEEDDDDDNDDDDDDDDDEEIGIFEGSETAAFLDS